MKIHPMESDGKKKRPIEWWVWIVLALIGLLVISTVFDMLVPNSTSPRNNRMPMDTMPSAISETMSPEEKALYNADPASAGFPNVDRQYLKEHGVSEQEARAAETILRQNGVN